MHSTRCWQFLSCFAKGRDKAKVTFEEPVRSVTPGQAAVFDDDDYVVGGGIILWCHQTFFEKSIAFKKKVWYNIQAVNEMLVWLSGRAADS